MKTNGDAHPTLTFLIVVGEVLFGQDIAGAIEEALGIRNTVSRVITAGSIAQAEAALAGVSELSLAFLQVDPSVFVRSTLARKIAECGGRVFLMGYDAENAVRDGEGGDWALLPMPFSDEQIRFLLEP